jgi:hypothetical protein
MTSTQTITIENKRFAIIPEKDYLNLLQDIEDLKKVLKRRNESGMEANSFFKKLAEKKKLNVQ